MENSRQGARGITGWSPSSYQRRALPRTVQAKNLFQNLKRDPRTLRLAVQASQRQRR